MKIFGVQNYQFKAIPSHYY